jgi:hypothetical protein
MMAIVSAIEFAILAKNDELARALLQRALLGEEP